MATAAQMVAKAVSQIGVKESPSGSNNTKYGKWYGMNYQPWCDMFVSWCAAQVGAGSIVGKYAYCPFHVDFFKKRGEWLGRTSNPQPGDIVFFANRGTACHVGIVEKRLSSTSVQTIEGNTSVSSNDNGGAVMRRTRNYGSVGSSWYVLGFARPKYSANNSSQKPASSSGSANKPAAKKTVSQVAQEVIDGKWGTGEDRKKRLKAAGYDYDAVQREVNAKLKSSSKPAAKPSSKPKFPLPSGHWYGTPSQDARNHSGFYDTEDRPAVKRIQAVVGVAQDGKYGPKTKDAVKKWQAKHGVTADGLVGAVTWGEMF